MQYLLTTTVGMPRLPSWVLGVPERLRSVQLPLSVPGLRRSGDIWIRRFPIWISRVKLVMSIPGGTKVILGSLARRSPPDTSPSDPAAPRRSGIAPVPLRRGDPQSETFGEAKNLNGFPHQSG